MSYLNFLTIKILIFLMKRMKIMSENSTRLNKYISTSGYTSRRKADDLIFSGRVKVNGKVEKNPAYRVDLDRDEVVVEGNLISSKEKLVYIILNKPENIISSAEDQFDRKTVVDL